MVIRSVLRTTGGRLYIDHVWKASETNTYSRAILQKYVPKIVWFVFNVTFISFIQSVLLFTFSCVPAYAILLSSKFESKITASDQMYFLIQVLLVVGEWFSDGQQYSKRASLLQRRS